MLEIWKFYFNTKEYKKDNEMRIKAAGDANKTLSVEQWATDIVAASITISRVIVPVGWRTESGKGGGEINEQTRDRAEKLANTRITPLRHPSCANARTKRRKSLSEFWLRLETLRKAQSVNQDGLSNWPRRCLFPRQRFPKSAGKEKVLQKALDFQYWIVGSFKEQLTISNCSPTAISNLVLRAFRNY